MESSDLNCRFCGKVVEGRTPSSSRQLPAAVTSAVERLRVHLRTPDAAIDHLAEGLRRVLPRSGVHLSRSLLGGSRELQVKVGTIAYSFRQEGGGLVVERQSVAGGFAVGMKDLLPASRWPEQLVIDVANNADATGQDWKATIARL